MNGNLLNIKELHSFGTHDKPVAATDIGDSIALVLEEHTNSLSFRKDDQTATCNIFHPKS
jgi:hypothetical protein